MNRSIFQILRDTPLNPNSLYGSSGAWNLSDEKKLNLWNRKLKGFLSKYLVPSTIAVFVSVVALATYHFDALKWIEKRLPSWKTVAQSKQSPERKSANINTTQKADKRKGKR